MFDLLPYINLSLFILLRMKQRKLQFTFRNTSLFCRPRQNHLCLFSFKWSKELLFEKKDFAYLLCRPRQRTSICVFFFEWHKENYVFLIKKILALSTKPVFSREMFTLVLFLLYWSEVFSRVNTVTNLGKWRQNQK